MLVSAGLFILFGFIGSYQVAAEQLHLQPASIVILVAMLIGAAVYYLINKNDDGNARQPLMDSEVN